MAEQELHQFRGAIMNSQAMRSVVRLMLAASISLAPSTAAPARKASAAHSRELAKTRLSIETCNAEADQGSSQSAKADPSDSDASRDGIEIKSQAQAGVGGNRPPE